MAKETILYIKQGKREHIVHDYRRERYQKTHCLAFVILGSHHVVNIVQL